MSPEQSEGDLDRLGPWLDVYSLGATLYCLLTGRPPFPGNEPGTILRAVQRREFRPPRQLDGSIDPALEAVCLRAMALKSEARYATAKNLAEEIERWMADEPVAAWREPILRRAGRWARRNRTAVTAAAVALVVTLRGTATVPAVQVRANAELTLSNDSLTDANARLKIANAELVAAIQRERDRFHLAMDAVKLFHGEVSEDFLLKE
jgi:eukaryotic-like serine/threonine-protein kinase